MIIAATIVVLFATILLFWILAFSPLDFSQDYKDIPGVENIVFQRDGQRNQFYDRTLWDLEWTDAPAIPISSKEDEGEIDAFADLAEQTSIRQAIFLSDGNYNIVKYNPIMEGLSLWQFFYKSAFLLNFNIVRKYNF